MTANAAESQLAQVAQQQVNLQTPPVVPPPHQ